MTSKRNFLVDRVQLDDIDIAPSSLTFTYSLDGEPNRLTFTYDEDVLDEVFSDRSPDTLQTFAAALGLLAMSRFAPVLPRCLDVGRYGDWMPTRLVEFVLEASCRLNWSEHRYQLGQLAYPGPEVVADGPEIGCRAVVPIFGVEDPRPGHVIVSSGSGKDSLLCEALLQRAGIQYETYTYLYDLYGDLDHQRRVFGRLRSATADAPRANSVSIQDDLEPWLRRRMDRHGLTDPLEVDGLAKPFRTESGEDFAASFAMVPLQVARQIGVQCVGAERSADHPNLDHPVTGEAVCHQWGKSFVAEAALNELYQALFTNVSRVSLTKPLYDVKIFETLFAVAGDRPYLTNSCNREKPWCGRCEKCLYVFAGFSAFGDHGSTVGAFEADLFAEPELLHVWEDLLGLNDRIPWECVGHPEETQLYFYRAAQAGRRGCAIDLFLETIWKPLAVRFQGSDAAVHAHFDGIYKRRSTVDPSHHHMPPWLSDRVLQVINRT